MQLRSVEATYHEKARVEVAQGERQTARSEELTGLLAAEREKARLLGARLEEEDRGLASRTDWGAMPKRRAQYCSTASNDPSTGLSMRHERSGFERGNRSAENVRSHADISFLLM